MKNLIRKYFILVLFIFSSPLIAGTPLHISETPLHISEAALPAVNALTYSKEIIRFARHHSVFIWDVGDDFNRADKDDVYFDWTRPCSPEHSIVKYNELINREANPVKDFDQNKVLSTLPTTLDVNSFSFAGSTGNKKSPLILVFPAAHPQSVFGQNLQERQSSRKLHESMANSYLKISNFARHHNLKLVNASESLLTILDSEFLARARKHIGEQLPREAFNTDQEWIRAIYSKGTVDASQFLAMTKMSDSHLIHTKAESEVSYIKNVILLIVLEMRMTLDLRPNEVLTEFLQADDKLIETFMSLVTKRYRENKQLMNKILRRSDVLFDYSSQTEDALIKNSTKLCEHRSSMMFKHLTSHEISGHQPDIVLLSVGPLHLHGLIRDLYAQSFRFLLLSPKVENH